MLKQTKKKEIRKNDDHNRDLSKIEPKLNDVRRCIDELKSASKSDNYYQYEKLVIVFALKYLY